MAERFPHPTMPPLGPHCRADRGMLDEELAQERLGFCNEQARVYARFCQVAGIPARFVYLFYTDQRTGHTIAEIYVDGRWAMADASWFCVFPGPDGRWLSAAECHEEGPIASTWARRISRECSRLRPSATNNSSAVTSPRERRGRAPPKVRRQGCRYPDGLGEKTAKSLGDQLWKFGIINYPLPD